MTPKSFAIVACRLLAIWFFVDAVHDFVRAAYTTYTYVNSSSGAKTFAASWYASSVVYSVALPLINLCACCVLWIGASTLAKMMLGAEIHTSNESRFEMRNWQSVGLSLIGAFVALQGISALTSYLVLRMSYSTAAWNAIYSKDLFTGRQIATAAVQTILGLILLFRAQKTIRVLEYLQRGGRDETSDGTVLNDDVAS